MMILSHAKHNYSICSYLSYAKQKATNLFFILWSLRHLHNITALLQLTNHPPNFIISNSLSLITIIKHHQQASISFLPLRIVPISDVFFFIDKTTSFFFFFFHNTNIEPLTTNFTYTSPPKVTRSAFSLHRFTPSHNNSPSLTSKQQLHPTLKLTKPQYKLVSDNLNTLTTTITGNQTSLNHKNPCPNIYNHHLREGMLMLLALLHLSQHLRNPLLNNSLRIQTLTTYCIIVHTQTCTTK